MIKGSDSVGGLKNKKIVYSVLWKLKGKLFLKVKSTDYVQMSLMGLYAKFSHFIALYGNLISPYS